MLACSWRIGCVGISLSTGIGQWSIGQRPDRLYVQPRGRDADDVDERRYDREHSEPKSARLLTACWRIG
jgi:hypothetical protein